MSQVASSDMISRSLSRVEATGEWKEAHAKATIDSGELDSHAVVLSQEEGGLPEHLLPHQRREVQGQRVLGAQRDAEHGTDEGEHLQRQR